MLTEQQNIPNKPMSEKQKWTIRSLFPVSNIISNFVKTFNFFELFAGFMIVITGIGELFGREFSWFWYIILILILGCAFYFKFYEHRARD